MSHFALQTVPHAARGLGLVLARTRLNGTMCGQWPPAHLATVIYISAAASNQANAGTHRGHMHKPDSDKAGLTFFMKISLFHVSKTDARDVERFRYIHLFCVLRFGAARHFLRR